MELLYILLVLLVITRCCGAVAARLGQPTLVGELLSGIALGVIVNRYAATLPVLSDLTNDHVFKAITELGVFVLMLAAGLEMQPRDIVKTSGKSAIVAIGGMLVPMASGIALGWAYIPDSSYKLAQCVFLGTALAITAVPVAIRVLMDLKILDTKPGKMIVSAAIIDDMLSLILLAVLTALIKTGEFPGMWGLAILVGKAVGFVVITSVAGRFLMPRIAPQLKRMRAPDLEFSFVLIVGLACGLLAEAMGIHFILGAFMAGLWFGRNTIDEASFEDVQRKVSGLSTGFLAPIFFASIGMQLDAAAITNAPVFVVLMLVVAVASKLIGTGLPAYLLGLKRRHALCVGLGMSARGAVELIIADIALKAGLFAHPKPTPEIIGQLFSTVVIIAVLTSIITPIGLRLVVRGEKMD
jgi:Kef-type K+ transport system membrane component KefB